MDFRSCPLSSQIRHRNARDKHLTDPINKMVCSVANASLGISKGCNSAQQLHNELRQLADDIATLSITIKDWKTMLYDGLSYRKGKFVWGCTVCIDEVYPLSLRHAICKWHNSWDSTAGSIDTRNIGHGRALFNTDDGCLEIYH